MPTDRVENHQRTLRQEKDKQDEVVEQKKKPKRKAKRAHIGDSSLRRVAVEAQRSRDASIIKGSGKTRHVDPEAITKEVTAYCAAETYNISVARRLLREDGFKTDPFHTSLYPQVLHVQTPNYVEKDRETGQDRTKGAGDIFVFPSGTVAAWNVPESVAYRLVQRVLPPAATNSHLDKLEAEDLDYLEDATKPSSEIIGDTIILGTANPSPTSDAESPADQTTDPQTSAILAKIAFSSALARSTKLAVLETQLSLYFTSTRSIPTTLSSGRPLGAPYTRSFILRKTGELLSIRAQLNLYSELTDSLPDLFWDSPHELGLENYYDSVGRALDVGVRIKVLNEKMDYASEIAGVLRERLSEKHSTGLEWLIIGLISIEVVFGLGHFWREWREGRDPERTQVLLDEWLRRELGKRPERVVEG
ncbi:hypothetical protein MBLNU230_g7172t1 [Neophaeotheca triangularis]